MEHEKNEVNNVLYLTEPTQEFEEVYARVRTKENRWLSDDLVKGLPIVPNGHPHEKEWKKRVYSLNKILEILKKAGSLRILEIGCGNGWFSNKLVESGLQVDAVDIGKEELEQAARCFKSDQLRFICCNNLSLLDNSTYDTILFNASIQYFGLTRSFWELLNSKLQENGKIFIMDSPIYNENEVISAKYRSEEYFNQLNEPDASSYYKHLTWSNIPKHKALYSPSKLKRLFNSNQSPFPIIQINKGS